jgi:hypothetical protein
MVTALFPTAKQRVLLRVCRWRGLYIVFLKANLLETNLVHCLIVSERECVVCQCIVISCIIVDVDHQRGFERPSRRVSPCCRQCRSPKRTVRDPLIDFHLVVDIHVT